MWVRLRRAAPSQLPLAASLLILVAALCVAAAAPAAQSSDEAHCCAGATMPEPSVDKPARMAFIIGAQKSGTTYLFDELVAR